MCWRPLNPLRSVVLLEVVRIHPVFLNSRGGPSAVLQGHVHALFLGKYLSFARRRIHPKIVASVPLVRPAIVSPIRGAPKLDFYQYQHEVMPQHLANRIR